MKEPLIHLLRPKEFRTFCRPKKVPDKLEVTNKPSKATCIHCLTNLRYANGHKKPFRVKWTGRNEPLPYAPKLDA